MAVVSSAKDEFREVKVKFIPIANEYKGKPLTTTQTVEGRTYKAELRPGRWCKVPVFMARNLKRMSQKGMRARVPDGFDLEKDMESGRYNHEDGGIRANMVEEYDPKFELIIDGNL